MKSILPLIVASFSITTPLIAQTTWNGNVIITGDLDVGDNGTKGNLEVNGETGSAAAPSTKITGDGGIVFEGTFGTGPNPGHNAGSRFMWYPAKAALRAGYTSFGVEWSDPYIGSYSIALGLDPVAEGDEAVAIGSGVSATEVGAMGLGTFSVAMGEYSTAIGGGVASGGFSLAMMATMAAGDGAISAGMQTVAHGEGSVAIGVGNASHSAYSVVLGRGGISQGDPYNWVETDPLFVVGNGQADIYGFTVTPNNAFVIFKNGDVKIPKRQGDILMGEFGLPE